MSGSIVAGFLFRPSGVQTTMPSWASPRMPTRQPSKRRIEPNPWSTIRTSAPMTRSSARQSSSKCLQPTRSSVMPRSGRLALKGVLRLVLIREWGNGLWRLLLWIIKLGRALGHFILALIGLKRILFTNIFQRL
ncbi:unnamed protein product [Symbiodinium sp. CCMP2592]|nr:unnamed protein product [Symbiodinium sp. CCMP2592]